LLRRPDLLQRKELSEEERQILAELEQEFGKEENK